MKKIILSIVCMMSANYAVMAMGPSTEFAQLVLDSATPEAQQAVYNVEKVITDPVVIQEFAALLKVHGKESISWLAQKLKGSLSTAECADFIDALNNLYDWYTKFFALTSDEQALQTPAGREIYMQHQMKMLQLLQKPFIAAIALRILEVSVQLEENSTDLKEAKVSAGNFVIELLAHFKTELAQ